MKKVTKNEVVKQVIEKLIFRNKQLGNQFTREVIDNVLLDVVGIDKRTRENWFNYLWHLNFIIQPQPGLFSINVARLSDLELQVQVARLPARSQHKLKEYF